MHTRSLLIACLSATLIACGSESTEPSPDTPPPSAETRSTPSPDTAAAKPKPADTAEKETSEASAKPKPEPKPESIAGEKPTTPKPDPAATTPKPKPAPTTEAESIKPETPATAAFQPIVLPACGGYTPVGLPASTPVDMPGGAKVALTPIIANDKVSQQVTLNNSKWARGIGRSVLIDDATLSVLCFTDVEGGLSGVFNGVPGPAIDKTTQIGINHDRNDAPAVFSPDGTRVAYIGLKDGKANLVIDNVLHALPSHENSVARTRSVIEQFRFSEDSSRYICRVRVAGAVPEKFKAKAAANWVHQFDSWQIMICGKLLEPVYSDIIGLTMSPDGKRVAYFARTAFDDEHYYLFLDGGVSGPFDKPGECRFIDNKTHFATATTDRIEKKLINGKADGAPVTIDGITLRRTSGEALFTAEIPEASGGGTAVVFNDKIVYKADPAKQRVSYLTMSPDGKRYAFVLSEVTPIGRGDIRVVVDGVAGEKYKQIEPIKKTQPMLFSPDSTKLAYLAKAEDFRLRLAIEGKEVGGFQQGAVFGFAPKGNRWVMYGRGLDNLPQLMIDGEVVPLEGARICRRGVQPRRQTPHRVQRQRLIRARACGQRAYLGDDVQAPV